MPAEGEKCQGIYHPLHFVNSQRLSVPAPSPLPKLRNRRMKPAEVNGFQVNPNTRPWLVKDSQLNESSSPDLPPIRKPRNVRSRTVGQIKTTIRRRQLPDPWDMLAQKTMTEGDSSAEDISPSKAALLENDRLRSVTFRKSPKKKQKTKEIIPQVEETPEPVSNNQTTVQNPVQTSAHPQTPQGNRLPESDKHIQTSPNRLPESGRNVQTSQAVGGESRDGPSSKEESGSSGRYRANKSLNNSLRDAMELLEGGGEGNEGGEGGEGGEEGGGGGDHQVSLQTLDELQQSTKRLFLYFSNTPDRGERVTILCEDSPDYRSGRVPYSHERSPLEL